MSVVKKLLIYSITLGLAGSAIAFTGFKAEPDATDTSYAIEIRSKYLLVSSSDEAEPEQSTKFLESYFNPLSLSLVDSQLDQYSTFAVNNVLLDWEQGYAVKTRNGKLFLCKTQNLDMDNCVRVYQFMKHGMSKNPFPEIG